MSLFENCQTERGCGFFEWIDQPTKVRDDTGGLERRIMELELEFADKDEVIAWCETEIFAFKYKIWALVMFVGLAVVFLVVSILSNKM